MSVADVEPFKACYLYKEEVEYELRIRSVHSRRNADDKKKILSRLLEKERAVPGKLIDMSGYQLDFVKEKSEIDATLTSISNFVEGFEGSETDVLFLRLKSRLAHVSGRVKRMPLPAEEPENEAEKESWREAVDYQREAYATCLITEAQLHDASTPSSTLPLPAVGTLSIVQTEPMPQKPTTEKIAKWGIQFDGDPKKLYSFLELITEVAKARKTSEQALFASAVEFFTKDAFSWFLSVKDSLKDWNSLVNQLKKDFLPRDIDDELWEAIKQRRQHKEERVTVYIAHMENLFSRLSRPPHEFTRVKHIRQNLLIEYYKQLALLEIETVRELKELAKKLEDSNLYLGNNNKRTTNKDVFCYSCSSADDAQGTNSFSDPSRRGARGFRGNFQRDSRGPNNSQVQRAPQPSRSGGQTAGPPKVICWNCQGANHTYFHCTDKRRLFCLSCGKANIKTNQCSCRIKN